MKIKFSSDAAKLAYNNVFEPSTELSAGVDLRYLGMNKDLFISTGVSVAIPPGYVGLIFIRSGTGLVGNVQLRNSVGVIDADYRGEIMAKLNGIVRLDITDDCPLKILETGKQIEVGDRFAQIVVVKHESGWEVVDDLNDTDRSAGGIGSTGTA